MITQIHDKKNELFEVEFYKDKECTEVFDFIGKENLYIKLVNGELTPLVYAIDKAPCGTKIYCSYANNEILNPLKIGAGKKHIQIITIDDITPNLSKYIPEDNAVLFLSEETNDKYKGMIFKSGSICISFTKISTLEQIEWLKQGGLFHNKVTILIDNGTQSELQKANEVAKELKEKYGVKEVNLFVLHWFDKELYELIQNKNGSYTSVLKYQNFNKIITTNSTSILKPEDSNERLQVIDCKEIFEENLNGTI